MARAGRWRAVGLALTLGLAGLLVGAAPMSAAADVQFGPPSASGTFGEAISFETTFRAEQAPVRVELLTTLPGDETRTVTEAAVEETAPGTWRAVVRQAGHVVPNTTYDYRFRVVTADGEQLGPSASHRVVDERLEWQQLRGDGVTVWWDQRRPRPSPSAPWASRRTPSPRRRSCLAWRTWHRVDFFIYSDDREFRQALGPGTRENVGGEAHPYIHTLFGLIEPQQVTSDWVEELVVHELAHIVFDEAVDNPYGYPPRWLNEGLAVYLAKGYDDGDRAQVAAAARAGSLIPLEGLAWQFPTTRRPLQPGLRGERVGRRPPRGDVRPGHARGSHHLVRGRPDA